MGRSTYKCNGGRTKLLILVSHWDGYKSLTTKKCNCRSCWLSIQASKEHLFCQSKMFSWLHVWFFIHLPGTLLCFQLPLHSPLHQFNGVRQESTIPATHKWHPRHTNLFWNQMFCPNRKVLINHFCSRCWRGIILNGRTSTASRNRARAEKSRGESERTLQHWSYMLVTFSAEDVMRFCYFSWVLRKLLEENFFARRAPSLKCFVYMLESAWASNLRSLTGWSAQRKNILHNILMRARQATPDVL